MLKCIFYIMSFTLISFTHAQDIDKKLFFLPNTDIDVVSYSLELVISEVSRKMPIKSKLIIRLKALKNLKSIKLHATKGSIEIVDASIENSAVTFAFLNDYVLELNSSVMAGEYVTVELKYNITVGQLSGPKRGLFFDNNVLSIENWPYFTRRWIPSNDSPSDPAKFEIKVSAPEGISVISNGLIVSKDNDVFHWKSKNAIPSYGLNLVIGKYIEKSTQICINTSQVNNQIDNCNSTSLVLPLNLYIPHTTKKSSLMSAWSKVLESSKSVAFFSSILGQYKFEKVGFVSAKQSFNMEYPSLITGLGANVHEIAHHWFGNSVFIGHWGDLWISEGFTTYLEGLYEEVFHGQTQSRWMATPNGQFNFKEQTDPYKIFDDKPYITGASSVHALRVMIRNACLFEAGSENDRKMIYAILRSIYQNFKGKNLRTGQLINYLINTIHSTIIENTKCTINEDEAKNLVQSWKKEWFPLWL